MNAPDTGDREGILAALAAPAKQAPPVEPLPEAAGRRGEADLALCDGLWVRFAEMLAALGGRVVQLEDLEHLAGRVAWLDEDVHLDLPFERAENIWEAEVGIVMADLAIAETGSLLLSTGPGRRRLTSLAPPTLVVVVPLRAIVDTLDEAWRSVSERSSVLISGPSRTADIEGILIRGIHGPGELWVVPV